MTIESADLVVVLFAAYGAAAVVVVYSFRRWTAGRQPVSRRSHIYRRDGR